MTYTYCPTCATPLIEAELGGNLRRKCPKCAFVFWDNPTPVVAAIVEHEGKVILTRNPGWPAGWLGLVAGFLEKNETPEQGILREIKEELGLEAEIVSFLGHYVFELRNQIIFAYHLRAEGEIVISDELESIQAIPPEEIQPWELGTGPALKDWLARRHLGG